MRNRNNGENRQGMVVNILRHNLNRKGGQDANLPTKRLSANPCKSVENRFPVPISTQKNIS